MTSVLEIRTKHLTHKGQAPAPPHPHQIHHRTVLAEPQEQTASTSRRDRAVLGEGT